MSTRRSTRERRKPKAVYEVEDHRKDPEEEEEDVEAEEEREPHDDTDEEREEEEGDDDEEEAFELDKRKSTPKKRTRASPQSKRASATKKTTTPKPRKLKPVPEETRARKQQSGEGEADGEDGAEEDEDDVFFEAVKGGKASLADLVVEWRERFDEDSENATREVLNFVLQSCGGTGQCVPATEKLEKLDMSDLVDYVVDDLEKSNDGYPIASRVKALKKYHQNFSDFWDAFIKECYESELMFSTQIVDQFVDWLTSLSSAEVRAIRHTTTIAAYAIGNALVDCIDKLTQQLSVVQRQLNAESTSSASKKTSKSPRKGPLSKKLEQLRENKKMFEERQTMLLELVQLLFNGVVVHRYRDVMPEIRAESVRVLGNWISVVPDRFLKDNYLKYLGWVLNDKDAHVRLSVVEVLLPLYENEDFAGKMELFTSRFLPRFLELCNDIDDDVVEACIKLLIAIDKRSLISSDVELHSVERLVFDESNDVIRKVAAEFVCLQYDAFGVAESNRSVKLTKEQLNTQAIALVEFAEEYITNHNVPPEAVATMVDAFWGLDDCQVLQDWKLLTSLLLADKNAPDLTSDQQTLLIRLLLASVGKITSEETEKQSGAKKKLAKDKEELCVTFCKEIPSMLVRFQADVEKLSLLVELIPLLTLTGEVSGLQPAHVKSLLEKLRHAYTANSEVGLLKSLALSIHHLRKSDIEVIKRESDVIIHELLQDVLDKLEEALQEDEKLSAEGAESREKSRSKKRASKKKDLTDSEYAVRTALSRLQCLITHICVREFLPHSQGGASSGTPGKRKRARGSTGGSASPTSRMDALAVTLVDFIRRRTRKVTELDPTILEPESINSALNILFADVLWLTRPVFSRLSQKEQDGGSSTRTRDDDVNAEIERICTSRSLVEDAVTAVLEMHMNKIEKPRDDDDENEESQIEMEEISLGDPKVALYVKEAQRSAFLIFCDTRCLFVERFKDCSAPFDTLDWSLSKVLVLLTQMYFENEMESTGDDLLESENNGDDENPRLPQKTSADRGKAEILVALGRVSQSNPSNKRQAAAVLRYLIDGGQDSQEVVRAFSKHIKSEAPVRYLEVQMTALRQLYMTILGLKEELSGIEEDEATQEELEETIATSEMEVKELAKKLSQSLGVGKVSASLRAPFFRFLCEGVRYALERPAQFSFLDVLRVYLSHLDKSSTKQLNAYFTQLLEDLEEDVPADGDDISSEWRTLFDFQSMISDPDGVVRSAGAASKALKRKRKFSVASSRGRDDIGSQVDMEEADADMESGDEGTPQKKRRNTSTTGANAPSSETLERDDTSLSNVAKSSPRTSSAKRKLEVVDEETPSSKKSRDAHNQPRRASSGRITQLSDDEDDHNDQDNAERESKDENEPRDEGRERDDDEDEERDKYDDDDEIASRRSSRRRGRGRN